MRPFRGVNAKELARVEYRTATIYLGQFVMSSGERCAGPVRIEGFDGHEVWKVK